MWAWKLKIVFRKYKWVVQCLIPCSFIPSFNKNGLNAYSYVPGTGSEMIQGKCNRETDGVNAVPAVSDLINDLRNAGYMSSGVRLSWVKTPSRLLSRCVTFGKLISNQCHRAAWGTLPAYSRFHMWTFPSFSITERFESLSLILWYIFSFPETYEQILFPFSVLSSLSHCPHLIDIRNLYFQMLAL